MAKKSLRQRALHTCTDSSNINPQINCQVSCSNINSQINCQVSCSNIKARPTCIADGDKLHIMGSSSADTRPHTNVCDWPDPHDDDKGSRSHGNLHRSKTQVTIQTGHLQQQTTKQSKNIRDVTNRTADRLSLSSPACLRSKW